LVRAAMGVGGPGGDGVDDGLFLVGLQFGADLAQEGQGQVQFVLGFPVGQGQFAGLLGGGEERDHDPGAGGAGGVGGLIDVLLAGLVVGAESVVLLL
jgi:hypothetical protein